MLTHLKKSDPKIYIYINKEISRQKDGLEMIASENYASVAVIEALGTPLTNKYSEGYPGKRYYGGNKWIDEIETLAIERAKKLFGAEHANVQPHAGAQANAAAYFALLEPGEKILAMNLSHGGHLTHGAKFNFSGKFYQVAWYGVRRDSELIDMDEVRAITLRERPKVIVAGYTAYPRKLDFSAFRKIADEVGAYLMVDMAHFAGLVAARVYPDPVPYADVITSTTHKTLRGPRGAMILCKINDRYSSSAALAESRSSRHSSNNKSAKTLAQKIDSAVFPGIQGGPLDHVIAAKAVCFGEALKPSFRKYQEQVLQNAKTLAKTLAEGGLRLISGGTDNHLVLVDLSPLGISGGQAEKLLDSADIYTNKNLIPYDTRKAMDPSGLRIGTPALTTRGMKEREMRIVGETIVSVLKNPKSEKILCEAKKIVGDLVRKFPIYQNLK